jgi:telomere length regulation protein
MVGKIRLEFKIEISEIRDSIPLLIPSITNVQYIMTINTPSQALQHLRDTLRTTQPDIDALINLLSTCLNENYLHTLDDSQVEVLRSFFVPQREAAGIRISRWIALTSYLTLPPFLNAPSATASIPDLPIPSRTFLLEILDRLNGEYGVDEMYWAVWSGVEEREKGRPGPEELIWEEVTRSLVGVPAKAANAVGRWKSDGWIGDIQERLLQR